MTTRHNDHTRFYSRRRARPQLTRGSARAGMTLVELTVAILIFAVGVLGLVSTAGMVTRQLGEGGSATRAATVAQTRFETIAARSCPTLTSGWTTTTTNTITETWGVSDSTNNIKVLRDTVRYNTPRGSRLYAFQTLMPCRPGA
ncbi:MAG: hypothetical protein NVS4B3_20080 [Gemmatimonadaceae bacterium]